MISANFFRNAFVKNFQEITCTNCLEHSLFLYIVPNFIAFFSSKSLSHINSEIGRFFKTKARHVLNIFLPSLYALHLFNVTKMLAASDFWTGFRTVLSLDLSSVYFWFLVFRNCVYFILLWNCIYFVSPKSWLIVNYIIQSLYSMLKIKLEDFHCITYNIIFVVWWLFKNLMEWPRDCSVYIR